MASTAALSAFPSPFSIETPPGCEGWEEMYPYYSRFDERRRESDENRFWFWNSMHFPLAMPAFDVICIDSPYQAVGSWQNRVFAVPPAMGIDYRIVNGYVYISGNPVTDPAKIAERAGFFERRAGYYYEHWDELYGRWKAKMEALIAELGELQVPELPEYEPDEVAFGDDRNTAFYELLHAYGRVLRLGDLMWQHHFEFLLLGYGAYATFADFCKGQLPDIPDQHIAQMVAGIDVLLFRPDAELRRLAQLALDTGVDGAFAAGRSPAEVDAALGSQRSRPRVAGGARAGQGPVVQHGHRRRPLPLLRQLARRPADPVRVAQRTYRRAARGRRAPASDRGDRARARAARRRVPRPARRGRARSRSPSCWRCHARVFPYVEEHKFYCDYWFLTRWWNKIREFGALLAEHRFLEDGEDLFCLTRHEVASALDELALTWATGGVALGPEHWPPIIARRKQLLERLGQWTPPPALGVTPEAITDPMTIMLWGVTTERVQEWARQTDGGSELTGAAAAPGVVEGIARVVASIEELADCRTARSSSAAAPRRRGRRSSRSSERPSRTSAA